MKPSVMRDSSDVLPGPAAPTDDSLCCRVCASARAWACRRASTCLSSRTVMFGGVIQGKVVERDREEWTADGGGQYRYVFRRGAKKQKQNTRFSRGRLE